LGVFHGAARGEAIAYVLQVKPDEALELCKKLVAVGLADMVGPYLMLDPGLGAALAGALTANERESAEGRWLEATMLLVAFLYEHRDQDTKSALHEVQVALTDLLAALAKLKSEVAGGRIDASKGIWYVLHLEGLVSTLGLPRILGRIADTRRDLSARLPVWGQARFHAESEEVDRSHEAGDVVGALQAARRLRDRVESAGNAYPGADYDRATAWLRLGRMLRAHGHLEESLTTIVGAWTQFSELGTAGDRAAAAMTHIALSEKGHTLCDLGRLDEAVIAFEDSIQGAKALGEMPDVAVGQAQLGGARFSQGRLGEALIAYKEALATFESQGQLNRVATMWHEIGRIHADIKDHKSAEQAYKKALAMKAAQGDSAGESHTLHQIGCLYDEQGRLEEAAVLFRQVVDMKRALGNSLDESSSLNNLGIAFRKLRRFDDAREALIAALAVRKQYGRAATPWNTYAALEMVERDDGRPEEAREARREALRTYRAYRTDGGEPMNGATRLIAAFGHALRDSGPDAARALLPDPSTVPDQFAPTLCALQNIAAGSRDPALANDPAHAPLSAVEVALLLESLPPAAPTSAPPPD
jgi:tetratricopeptide (TPR) repeat protein